MGDSSCQAPVDVAVAQLAAAQHIVFSLDQLRGLGLSKAAVSKRMGTRRLHRIHQAVYSLVPPELLAKRGHYMAAVLACGEGAVLSHRSAADLLGLRATHRARIDVTVPRHRRCKHRGIEVHRSTSLTPADVTIVDGIPCTTVARTIFDLAAVLRRRQVERAIDQAEVEELLDVAALQAQLAARPSARGAGVIKAILREHLAGSTLTWSELEERFLALVRRARLPLPQVNEWIVLSDGEPAIRGDFVWRAQRLVVETDGYQFHGHRAKFERDRRRDQVLVANGYRVMRITWRQLSEEPLAVTARLATALAAGN